MKNIMKFAATSVAMLIFAAAAAIAQPTPPTPDSGTPSFGNNSNTIVYPAWVTAVQQPSGIKSIFAPSAGVAGVNLGSVTADPSVLVNGDMWYNSTSNVFKMYQNGAIAIIATGGAGSFTTLAVSSTSALSGTVTVGGGGTSGANILFSGTTGSAPAGGIHLDAGSGLSLIGFASTTYDTTFSNPSNGNWLRNPHATQNAEIVGNGIIDGTLTVSGTSAFAGFVQSTGNVVGTVTNGTAQFGGISANGAEVCGKGSVTDVVLLNGTGAIAAQVPTGTTTFQSAGTTDSTSTSTGALLTSGGLGVSKTVTANHYAGGGASPSIAVGTGAGSGATASIVGNDTAGVITLNTGTGTSAASDFTFTFGTAYSVSPAAVLLIPANIPYPPTTQMPYINSGSTTTAHFLASSIGQTALTASTTYLFYYIVH